MNALSTLSSREKYSIISGIVVLLILVCVQFIFLPVMERKNELKRILAIEQDGIKQMTALKDQYLSLNRNMNLEQQALPDRGPGFTLFSFLDSQAEAAGIKKNIDYMRPFSRTSDDGSFQLSRVRLKLTGLYLNDFTDFLRRVESPGSGVHVVSMSLAKSGKNDTLLEAVLETQTLMTGEIQ